MCGDRIGLTFYGDAYAKNKEHLKDGATVILRGAQVRIKDAKFSISTTSFDLVYDKYSSMEVVLDQRAAVTASPKICTVSSLRHSSISTGDVAVVYLEHSEVEQVKTKGGKSFQTLAMTVADESTGARFSVLVYGAFGHQCEALLEEAASGDSLLLRCVSVDQLDGGWRAVLKRGGSFIVNSGTDEVCSRR